MSDTIGSFLNRTWPALLLFAACIALIVFTALVLPSSLPAILITSFLALIGIVYAFVWFIRLSKNPEDAGAFGASPYVDPLGGV